MNQYQAGRRGRFKRGSRNSGSRYGRRFGFHSNRLGRPPNRHGFSGRFGSFGFRRRHGFGRIHNLRHGGKHFGTAVGNHVRFGVCRLHHDGNGFFRLILRQGRQCDDQRLIMAGLRLTVCRTGFTENVCDGGKDFVCSLVNHQILLDFGG